MLWKRLHLASVSGRWALLAFMNLLFFGCVFVVVFLAQFLFPPPLYSGGFSMVPEVFLGSWFTMVLGVFAFNLAVSAFVVVTLPGVVFFPLSTGFLLFRAVLWGLLLCPLPTWLFLAFLPTLVLEGEAYVFAAVAGTVAGVSWIKPEYAYRGEGSSRVEAFKKALRECLSVYVLVAMFLLVAAVVENVTIVLLSSF